MKFYRGSAAAARAYVEQDRPRADDYYLTEGSGVATRYIASPLTGVRQVGSLTGESYERWVGGFDTVTGAAKGRLRSDSKALRFGEMAALRVSRLDLSRRRAMIAESVTVVQGRGLVWGTPKTHERRQVPIPKFLVAELHAHIADKRPDELVFTGVRGGGPLRAPIFRTGFDVAAQAIGVPGLHPHELRHTAASLAIASGADIKVVQQMLGHSSAAMTMDVYGHLFHDRLDEVADALDNARTEAAKAAQRMAPAVAEPCSPVANLLPNADVVHLSAKRARGQEGKSQTRRSARE